MDTNTLDLLKSAEKDLGENLTWLMDSFDLQVRQGNQEIMHRTMAFQRAWVNIAKAISANSTAPKEG